MSSGKLRKFVYERDRYICQLCGYPVLRKAAPNHALFPTLDHVIRRVHEQQVSEGCIHEAPNLVTAHRLCNCGLRHHKAITAELLVSIRRTMHDRYFKAFALDLVNPPAPFYQMVTTHWGIGEEGFAGPDGKLVVTYSALEGAIQAPYVLAEQLCDYAPPGWLR